MSRLTNTMRVAALAAVGAAVVSCLPDADVVGPPARTNNTLFASYVALGNSLTAGWQSGGINDSLQRRSYANLLAGQMQTRFAYPAFAAFGCPAPVGNFVSGKLIDSLVPAAQRRQCYLRSASSVTDILNNVGVPYAYAADLTTKGSAVITTNPLNSFILGGATQVERAIDADPTFATVWIGNNEVLFPASVGLLNAPAAGVAAPPLIPANVWIPQMAKAVNDLKAGSPHLRGGVLVGVVDVTNIPRFFPVDTLVTNVTTKAAFDAAIGQTVTIVPGTGCGTSGLLLSTEIINAIRAGTHPAAISCTKNVPQAPVGDIFMLDATEMAAIRGTAQAYNAYLQAKADSVGFAYLDLNPVLAQLRTAGSIPRVPTFSSRTAPFGTYFSLDGAHPSSAAHVVIANALIDAINAKYQTTLAKLP